MHVNNATSVDQWNYDSDRVCNLSLNFIEFFPSFFRNPRPSEQKRCERAREYLFECLRHSAKSHKLCGEEEEAAAENELKITSFIDITNTKWTVHVYYVNSLQIVVCLHRERGRSTASKQQHERFIDWNMTWKYQRVVWYILQIKYNVRDIIIARMSSCSISYTYGIHWAALRFEIECM